GIVFALVNFVGPAEKGNGAIGFTAKLISLSQRVEGETLLSGGLEARQVVDAIRKKALQKFGALATGAETIEDCVIQMISEKRECILIAFEADEGLVKLDSRREVFDAVY